MKFGFVVFLVLLHAVSAKRKLAKIRSTCIGGLPTHPFNGTGCGTPLTVDLDTFGDNARSAGLMIVSQRFSRFRITINLKRLPRPDLVLTAWLLWTFGGADADKVFDIANIDAPLAATTAAYTSGLGREPNQFKYTTRTTAMLKVKLDFNPTFPGEGLLTGKRFCFQKDIPGIQDTRFRQPPVAAGVFTPVTNYFLRKYESSGFEKLDKHRRPVLVRSPVRAIAIIVAVHIDQTTHGVTAGNFPTDNYELLSFSINGSLGQPLFTR